MTPFLAGFVDELVKVGVSYSAASGSAPQAMNNTVSQPRNLVRPEANFAPGKPQPGASTPATAKPGGAKKPGGGGFVPWITPQQRSALHAKEQAYNKGFSANPHHRNALPSAPTPPAPAPAPAPAVDMRPQPRLQTPMGASGRGGLHA